jgi:hypothetical protein
LRTANADKYLNSASKAGSDSETKKNNLKTKLLKFAEALETKEEKFFFRRKKKNANSSIAAILNITRAFSAPILLFLHFFMVLKD